MKSGSQLWLWEEVTSSAVAGKEGEQMVAEAGKAVDWMEEGEASIFSMK